MIIDYWLYSDPYDLPEGAVYQKQTVDGDVIHTDTYYPVKTREVTKKTIHKEAPHYEGIGPQDESGLPVGLRAHVKEENRHDWYKEMFKTIHKQDRPEEANTYEPSYHFPDEVAWKDNDQWSHDPTVNSSPPRSPPQRRVSPNTSARNTIDRYHQQPRSIIDYEPGASSLAERDKSVRLAYFRLGKSFNLSETVYCLYGHHPLRPDMANIV